MSACSKPAGSGSIARWCDGISDVLLKRFCRSHAIERMSSRKPDPRCFADLDGLPPNLASLAVHEFRPKMEWFVMRPFQT